MKKKLLKLLSLFTMLFFLGCQYQFSDDYYNEIELTKPSVSLSITNFNEGEILRSPKNIEYSYNAPGRNRLYEIQFYIDGNLVENTTEPVGTFFLDIQNLSNGSHTLKIEYYFKTSSGSLAEHSGLEYFVEIEEFSFKVDKTLAVLEIKEIEHNDGTIFIHFNDYPLVDEIEKSITATLLIYYEESRFPQELTLTKDVIEKGIVNDNFSIDFNFKYQTKIENNYGSVESEIKEINFPNNFDITASATEMGLFIFNWTTHPLYKNIKTAKLIYDIQSYYNNYSGSYVGLRMNTNQFISTNYVDTFIFGKKYEYRLELTANDNILTKYQTRSKRLTGEFYRGEKFEVDKYKKFLYDEISDKLYALSVQNNGSVYIDELNSNTLILVKRNFITNSNNSIGDFSFSVNKDFIIDLNTRSIEVNSNSFIITKEYNISEFDSSALNFNTIIRFRENTFAIDNIENFKVVTIYDIPTKTLILEKYRRKSNTVNISDDGNYFNIENKIYRKDNTTLSEVYSDEFQRELHTDFSTNTNKVYLAAGYVKEVDLLTYSINKIPNLGNMDRVEYLPSQNKTLSSHSKYNLTFHNLNTNEQNIKTIEIQDDAYFYLAQKDYLISPYGYVIKNYQ